MCFPLCPELSGLIKLQALKTPRGKLWGISMQGTFIFIFVHLALQQVGSTLRREDPPRAAGNTLAIHLLSILCKM